MSFAENGMPYPDRNPDIVSGSGSYFRGPDSIRTRIRTSCPDSAPQLTESVYDPLAGRTRYGTFMRHMGHRSSQTAGGQSGGATGLQLGRWLLNRLAKGSNGSRIIAVKEPERGHKGDKGAMGRTKAGKRSPEMTHE